VSGKGHYDSRVTLARMEHGLLLSHSLLGRLGDCRVQSVLEKTKR
jgi:hypothetical protein